MSGQRFDYSSERQRHENFVGRADLLARLDQLLVDDNGDRWVVITGGPGIGKSAILAAWLAHRETAGATVPHHFIRRGQYDWDDPTQLVGSLVAQLEERFAALREPEADARMHPAARLGRMLSRVSVHELVPRGERLVVLIDGLDEYDPPTKAPPGDPLAAFLPHVLPAGVSLLCACRRRHAYVASLAARDGEFAEIDLDDPSRASDNEATVRAFWEHAARPLGLDPDDPEDARFVEEAVARACGNVQHAVQLRKQLAAIGPEQRRRIDDIPRGLQALIAQSWERIAVDPIVVNGLGILCTAREALSLDQLGAVAGWTGEPQRRVFVHSAMELLVEMERPDGTREYRLHHDSIRAYIAREIGPASLSEHHRLVAQSLASWPCPADPPSKRYALRHAVTHRAEAGDLVDAWRLATDMSFLEARCRELGVAEAEADATRLAVRCRASGDDLLGQRADDLARALRRESHWLRVAPEATAALVWNQLRRSGWSTDDLDRQLRLALGTSFLRVRHLATRESPALERTLVGHTDNVTACAVTPDGRRVVSASSEGTLKVWDLATGQLVATLQGHAGWVYACAVTSDGRHVVSASGDETLKVWDLVTHRLVATLQGHTWWVRACAVTPDGRRVISASMDRTLKIWDLETHQLLSTLRGHTGGVTACAVLPDGRRVVSVSEDTTLKIWEIATGEQVAIPHGQVSGVTTCAVTPDGQRVVSASASDDRMLNVWDLKTGQRVATLQGHAHWVKSCAVTPDGRRVVSTSMDGMFIVWDLDTGQPVGTLQGHTGWVTACAVAPDGGRVVSASVDKTLKVWDLAAEQSMATLQAHAYGVTACAVAPDGRRVVSASGDQTLKVWDVGTGALEATLQCHPDQAVMCTMVPDGQRVISASGNGTLKVWDLVTGQVVTSQEFHSQPYRVTPRAVTPDGRRVVSTSDDGMLKVWDFATAELVTTLQGHTAGVTACVVTSDGERVVSASDDKTLRVWKLATGQAVATLTGHALRVRACAVTRDGRRAVSASDDGTLKVWDLTTGQLLATLQGHTAPVTACAVMSDGERVVSASEDRTLKVWDLASHTCLFTHRANAAYTAVDATATAIIAGDDIGSVWFLDMPPPYRGTSDLDRLVRADTSSSQVPAEQADRSSQPTREARMTRDDLLARLSNLLPPQFKAVLFRAKVPPAYLPGENAPQVERAIYAIHYLEQQHQLDRLGRILDEIASPS